MSGKSKKIIKNFWGSTVFSNIIAIVTLVVTIVFGLLAYLFPQSQNEQGNNFRFGLNGFAIFVFAVLIVLFLISIYNSRKTKIELEKYERKTKIELEKYEIIKILSDLQNKYILKPEFKTSGEHSAQSMERNLHDRGDARILTNSLNYDIFYCGSIAEHIIKGAKYIYVLPNEFQVLNDLKSYIKELYDNLYEQLKNKNHNNPNKTAAEVLNNLKNNVEFWFFDKDILCLYNFARFNQIGNPHFLQSWWYVNPVDNKDSSYMLAHEIDTEDQAKLNQVFESLNELSVAFDGKFIYDNNSDLNSTLVERK